jgi:septum formation protein
MTSSSPSSNGTGTGTDAGTGAPLIILGSSSMYRRQLLTEMGIAHECMSADIDERIIVVDEKIAANDNITKQSSLSSSAATAANADAAAQRLSQRHRSHPAQLTTAIARAKALALLPELRASQRTCHSLLITSDQVAFVNGCIREKPDDEKVWHNIHTSIHTVSIS